ncbi:Sodium-coupled monocarboxylate transporter 1 [Orchesella cincta]|uniref:Sodium-coupled monocarboxylate transporter 1 n=1 Tax=Orchesella cincta TaxID=48709 RepID=A0A1D2N038_ORCCI|nr:Sodium-coupled monocarboxylate transporter 1 [Orchesella cincta]
MLELGDNYFGVTDYILLTGTLLISLLIGLYYGYKGKNTNEELLVGGRNMSIIPVAASVMVTFVSAITILGFPAEIYGHGAQIFILHLVSACAFPISAYLIMPFFYRMKLTSINEYLEHRFDSVWIRWLAAGILILQQVTLSGVVLYAPSIALDAFLGFPMWMSVLAIGICATIYTSIGGLKAVVGTDLFQFFMMLIGMIAISWKGISAAGGFVTTFRLANERGRFNFFDFTFDPFSRHNFWNFLIGTGFHAIMQPGVSQLQVQRYSSMPTCSKAKQAIIGSVPLKLVFMSLCLLTGISIFAFYADCDPLSTGGITKIDQIVPYFVVHELADIPGMMGIFTSCIFSGVLSTLSSSLNSLSAVTWEDFLVRTKYFRAMTPKAQTNVSRLIGAIFGVICMGLAFCAQNLGAIYSATFAVIGATSGALYGVFLMGLFIPFVNAIGAIVGMLSGLIVMMVISIVAFIFKKTGKASLPMSTEGCSALNATSLLLNLTTTIPTTTLAPAPLITSISLDEWPWKVFSLSYLLYPIVTAAVTIIVGMIISLLFAACDKDSRRRPQKAYVHPLVRNIFSCCIQKESNSWTNGRINNGIPMSPIAIDTMAAYIQPKRESQGRINKGYVR